MVAVVPEEKVRVEALNLVYQNAYSVLLGEHIASLGILIVMWSHFSSGFLLAWTAYMLLASGLLRHALVFMYFRQMKKNSLHQLNYRLWSLTFLGGVIISGIGWGCVGSVLMLQDDIVRQTFNVFLLFGVTSVANTWYTPVKGFYFVFITLAFVPFILWLLNHGGPFIILSGLGAVYYAVMLLTSHFYYLTMYSSIYLKFQNDELIESLLDAKENIQQQTISLKSVLVLLAEISKARENELVKKAHFDLLTGLPNRSLLVEKIESEIEIAKSNGQLFAVCFADLDKFKNVNDTFGHATGDELLKIIANRLCDVIKNKDIVTREGGDEFVLIITSLSKENDIIPIVNRIIQSILQPIYINHKKMEIGVSMGISFYGNQYPYDLKELLRQADVAMYRAKEAGGNQFKFYASHLNEPTKKSGYEAPESV